MNKIVVLIALSFAYYSCTTLTTSNHEESVGGVSLKGLTVGIQRDIAQAPTTPVAGSSAVAPFVPPPFLPIPEGAVPGSIPGRTVITVEGVEKSIDPMLLAKKGKGFFDCNLIRKTTYNFNGKAYQKPILNDDNAMNCPNIKAFRTNQPWEVKKTEWSEQDEIDFGLFVKAIGESNCKNLDACLSTSGNPLRTEDDMLNMYYSDCADLPYYLRGYFAFKKGLPFSFTVSVAPNPLTPLQIETIAKNRAAIVARDGEEAGLKYDDLMNDSRYPPNGNMATERLSVPAKMNNFSILKLYINDRVSTAMYRMLGGDFYSPQINPTYVRRGTAIYGVKGHAAIIYDVKPNGEILLIDAHPGNSITHSNWIEDEFVLDKPEKGGMFKNFRPVKVVKGRAQLATDAEVPGGVSLEQYDASNFNLQGTPVSLREWVSLRLSNGTYRQKPIEEMVMLTQQLCNNYLERVESVQKSVDNGITRENLNQYPNNIFGASGDWETYSTPGSDLRRRSGTLYLVEYAKQALARYNQKHPIIDYKGSNLKADLVSAFQNTARSCKITYKNSVGAPVVLDLLQASKRVGLFSFDPYMCPEARWGASGAEYASCSDSAQKKEFYRLTQFLRNINEKNEKAVHGYTLESLRSLDSSKKVNNSPNAISYDVAAKILAL